MATSYSWPPAKGLSTVQIPRSDTILQMYASKKINAPGQRVLDAVLDVSNYNKWNTFCPEAKIEVQPPGGGREGGAADFRKMKLGSIMTFQVVMDASKSNNKTATGLKVTDISTPSHPSDYVPASTRESDSSFYSDLSKLYRVCWKTEGGFVSRGLRGERFHEIIVVGENECEVRTWECQGGILARTVKWMFQKTLMEKFDLWLADLKGYCEAQGRT
ncbi:hypothetical protein LTR78_005733 [Recurvomyces mirabilis]|uniref:Coenzyme Q-binding protein COQ10 START domain-containing protein n=1 Tax=Recurvomyces mirabilis TaxID=574656 RepID=A0AAE0WM56_9PEZI|nr:hypothetical protein LTR78_005733 [Recurvomyces mirabilis]KAK5154113.1 hypothetical protein LTS14_006798 [Recurvomyces mirabilis]